MIWQRLELLAPDSEVEKPLKEDFASLQARVNGVVLEQQRLDAKSEELKHATVDPKCVKGISDHKVAGMICLQDELAIRNEYDKWLVAYRLAAAKLGTVLAQRQTAIQAELIKKLIGIGFVDPLLDPLNPGRVTPAHYLGHPKLREARNRSIEVSSIQGTVREHIVENQKHRAETERELALGKDRMIR